ncbi:MAG: hypothetical protein IIC52_10550, partial [Proteobacteria bacterium]|nr:hypothetical protein [Pseudomonadota bacterium]
MARAQSSHGSGKQRHQRETNTMIKLWTGAIAATVLCIWSLGDSRPVAAAELPAATVKMLQKLKLSPDILKGLDQELKIPAAWVAGAKKEGPLKLGGTWDAEQ